MKGEVVGLIPGVDIYQLLTSGDLKAYIEGKAWSKVAAILGEQLVKLGAKTNVTGIIASLAIGAGSNRKIQPPSRVPYSLRFTS